MNEQSLIFVLLGLVFAIAIALTGSDKLPVTSVNWDGNDQASQPARRQRRAGKTNAFIGLGLVIASILTLAGTIFHASAVEWSGNTVRPNAVEWSGNTVRPNAVEWSGKTVRPNAVEWSGKTVRPNAVEWSGEIVRPNAVEWHG